MTTMNPFLVQSTLPYLAPHFDQIANHHYRPAFDEGIQQKRAEIAAIALNPQTDGKNARSSTQLYAGNCSSGASTCER